MKKVYIISLLTLALVFTSCSKPTLDPADSTTQAVEATTTTTTETITTEATTTATAESTNDATTVVPHAPVTDAEIIALSMDILELIKNEDYAGLATYVDDTYKLGLSPYCWADFSTLVYLTSADVAAIATSPTALTWGTEDGSGEPITMTPNIYFQSYVYDQDFLVAPQVSLDVVVGKGNTVDNTSMAPNIDHFVEFHFPSFDPQYDGLDWESLRLAFHVEPSGEFHLIYIIHDQWTI